MTVSPYRIPLRPDYAAAGQRRIEEDIRPLIRHLAAHALIRATNQHGTIDEATRHLFGAKAVEELQTRAAVTPTSTATAGVLAATGIGSFLDFLRPSSAAAELFRRVPRVSLSGMTEMTLPAWSTPFAEAPWIEEGAPIPVLQAAAAPVTLGPPKKLAAISTLTSELSEATGDQAEMIIATALRDAAGRALDSAVFSNQTATDARPAGLLAGVSATTATTGGGLEAAATDFGNLVNAIAAEGGGGDVLIFAAPKQAATIRLLAPGTEVITAPSLAAGTVVAVEREGVVSAFDGAPEVSVAKDAVLHMDDASPAHIGTAGSPNVVAAPVRSLYQTNALGVRVVLKVAFAKRFAGAVAFVAGTSW